jgi:integrase
MPAPREGSDLDALHRQAVKLRWSNKKAGVHLAKIARLFVEWAGPKMAIGEALTDDRVNEYVEWRMDEKRNCGGTINRHLSAISVLCRMAKVNLELPWQQEGVHRLRYYTEDEEKMILATTLLWSKPDLHDLFVFLVDTGARLGETRKLEWRNIRGRLVTFEGPTTKNHTTRSIVATPRVEAALERLRKRHHNMYKGPFAVIDTRELRTFWERLRAHFPQWMGKDTVVHTFRHTCASRLAMAGKSEVQIMRWMGHKNSATTQKYMHLSPATMDGLADALAHYGAPALVAKS